MCEGLPKQFRRELESEGVVGLHVGHWESESGPLSRQVFCILEFAKVREASEPVPKSLTLPKRSDQNPLVH